MTVTRVTCIRVTRKDTATTKHDGMARVKLIPGTGRTNVIDAPDSLYRQRWGASVVVMATPGNATSIGRWAKYCFAPYTGRVRSRTSNVVGRNVRDYGRVTAGRLRNSVLPLMMSWVCARLENDINVSRV